MVDDIYQISGASQSYNATLINNKKVIDQPESII